MHPKAIARIWVCAPAAILLGAASICAIGAEPGEGIAQARSIAATATNDRGESDRRTVAALDTQYQKAVEKNDVATMARILADDFILVEGTGKAWSKADLLGLSRSAGTHYEHQEDSERAVRVWGDTAVVTAKLWAKGTEDGSPVDYTEWFSDTYVRTPSGWRYVFGQASLPLPKDKTQH